MAEFIINIGDAPGPQGFRDGDIVHAHNDVYLLWQRTQRIADHRKESGGFFKPLDCMACKTLQSVSKYRFERISKTEMKRITLSDMSEEILSGTPNAEGHAIDLPQYMARRVAGGKLPMFGDVNSVVWFGGSTNVTLTGLSTLWTDHITPETGLLEADHKVPLYYTPHFLKKYLVVVTSDFHNTRRGILESPDVDDTDPENPITLAKRKHNIDWRNMDGISGRTIDDVLDPTKVVTVKRDLVRTETDIVRVRTR